MNNVLLHFIISINCYKIPSFSCVSFPTFRSSTHDNVILQGFFFVFSEWFANCCFCGAHRDKRVIFRLHTDRSNSFFSPDKEEKEWVFFVWTCTGHRLEERLWSYRESWPVAPPPAVAYIHLDLSLPRKPHYPPCILPGSFCWSVNATSSTPRCLWELSPREENIEEERKGRRWCTLSFFLSPSPLRRKLDVGTHHNLLRVKSLFPFEVLELNMKQLQRQEQASCWYSKGFTILLMSDGTRASSADIHFGFICWAWHTQTLITSYCFVTPMLTRGIAAVLNCNIIPALPLPRGTAYELMRCQQRCHVFIHSISPKEKKKHLLGGIDTT